MKYKTNRERADCIRQILKTSGAYEGSAPGTRLTDMITDALHYCDDEKLDFERIMKDARCNYVAEVREERLAEVQV